MGRSIDTKHPAITGFSAVNSVLIPFRRIARRAEGGYQEDEQPSVLVDEVSYCFEITPAFAEGGTG